MANKTQRERYGSFRGTANIFVLFLQFIISVFGSECFLFFRKKKKEKEKRERERLLSNLESLTTNHEQDKLLVSAIIYINVPRMPPFTYLLRHILIIIIKNKNEKMM